MARFTSLALVIALALGSASPARASEVTVEDCTLVKVSGTIIWVIGPCEGVGPCEEPRAAEVATKARITINGKPARLTDLPHGLRVDLTFAKVGEKVLVVGIAGYAN